MLVADGAFCCDRHSSLSSVHRSPRGAHPTLPRATGAGDVVFKGVHHVALLCEKLERSMEFYQGLLGKSSPSRRGGAGRNVGVASGLEPYFRHSVHSSPVRRPPLTMRWSYKAFIMIFKT